MVKDNKFYLSATGISTFFDSPKGFYNNYFGKDKKKNKDYIIGKLIHVFILEPETFDDKFIVKDIKLSDNLKLIAEEVIDSGTLKIEDSKLIRTDDFFNLIIKLCKDLNYYQNLSTDENRYSKVLKEGLLDYFLFYHSIGDKKLITSAEYSKAKDLATVILEDSKLSMLFDKGNSNVEYYTELHLMCEYNEFFGLHGFLDMLKIDHENKIIYLTDIKSTTKHLSRFIYEIKNLNYNLKIAHYTKLILEIYEDLFRNDYVLEVRFIVVDSYKHSIDFLISEDTLFEYIKMYRNELDNLTEAFTKNNWGNPIYYKNTIIL